MCTSARADSLAALFWEPRIRRTPSLIGVTVVRSGAVVRRTAAYCFLLCGSAWAASSAPSPLGAPASGDAAVNATVAPNPQQCQARRSPGSRKPTSRIRSFPGEEGTLPIIGITTSFGEAHVELTELERVLVADGYATLRSTIPIFTFGVEGVWGPVRVGLPV